MFEQHEILHGPKPAGRHCVEVMTAERRGAHRSVAHLRELLAPPLEVVSGGKVDVLIQHQLGGGRKLGPRPNRHGHARAAQCGGARMGCNDRLRIRLPNRLHRACGIDRHRCNGSSRH